jgi:hypothetical protein
MSFINWGEETPERRAERRRFEEDQMLYEQAVRMSRISNLHTPGASGRINLNLNKYVESDYIEDDYSD